MMMVKGLRKAGVESCEHLTHFVTNYETSRRDSDREAEIER